MLNTFSAFALLEHNLSPPGSKFHPLPFFVDYVQCR